MDSLTTLAICVAIGLFFEPGWRLHPGARAKIAEERAHHHHHHHESEGPTDQEEPKVHSELSQHSQPSEHSAPSPSVQHGSGAPGAPGPTKGFLAPGRMAFESINLQAKTAVSRGKSGLAAFAASCGAWLRGPVGAEIAVLYTLLSGALLLWLRYDESVQSPAVRPVSPLAPKLDLNDARGEAEFFDDWPAASWVFVVGLGLGLAFARAIYRATVVNSAPAAPSVVITKVQGRWPPPVAEVQSGAVEAKRTTPLPVRGAEGHKATLGKAGAKTKANGNRQKANDPAASEDVEKGEDKKVSKGGQSIPEEYSVWTPQTSWAAANGSSPPANDGWAPQNSWGEPLVVGEAAGKPSADAATAG